MAAPEWFTAHLDELRRLPGSRPSSARVLAEWAAQIGDSEAPSRPTISRWLGGTTLPTGFRQLELMVAGVREHTRAPTRRDRETLLRSGWWRDEYERALNESGRGDPAATPAQIVYQGLEQFGRDDADRFFGRGQAIEALRERVETLDGSPAAGLLVVLGQSGIGKSSLLAAGLLPALERGDADPGPASAVRPTAMFTPGPDPITALESAVEETRRSAGGRRAVLVVDQFEEIFHADDDVRERFVDALVEVATPQRQADRAAAVVVIACRNEFYPELRRLPSLARPLDAPFNLDPLTADELTDAIKEPARRVGITVGNDLVARLVADAGVSDGRTIEGKLPLISHVLRLMNQAGPMTVRAYERVGGIDGAVAHTAAQAWDELRRAGLEDTALALLVRLVRVGDNPGYDSRRRVPRHELTSSADGRADQALEILSDARLVTVGEKTVQITHEALLRAWQRLRDAIDGERTDHVLRQDLALRARQWDDAGRPPERLLRGTVLVAAHRVSAGRDATTGDLSREFLAAADEQERLAAVRTRRLWIAAATAAVLIIAAGTVAVVAGVAERRASQRAILSEVIAQAKQLTPVDSSLAAQLWLTAYRMAPSPDLYTQLLSAENTPLARPLRGHTDSVRAVARSGSTVISASEDGTVRLWPSAAGGPPPTVLTEPGPVTALAVDPARRIMISAASDAAAGGSALRVWSIADTARPVPLTDPLPIGTDAPVSGLATSPDGRFVVVAGSDGTTRLWSVADPARPADLGARLPGTTTRIYQSTAAVSPDNRTVAVAGDDGGTRLWDVTDPAHPRALPSLAGGSGVAHAVAFSPRRTMLVTGGGSGDMRLWDVADPARARLVGESPTALDAAPSVLALAVSPDENTVAAAGADNTVTLWNITNPAEPVPLGMPLAGHGRGVGAVAFGADGRTVVTGSADRTVREWSLPATRLSAVAGTVTSLSFTHDGRTLAAGGGRGDNAVHLWDTTDPAAPEPSGPPLAMPEPGFVNAIAISADDGLVAAASGSLVRMWDIRDPRRPRPAGPDVATPSTVGGVAISPDRRTLAVGGADGLTRLFSLVDPARPTPLPGVLPATPGKLVTTVDFGPDGRILAAAGADKQIRLWDTTDPARPRAIGEPLRGHDDQIFRISFSPDGKHLASVGANHTAHIWDLADPARPREGQQLLEQTDAIGGLAWSPDGATLATGSNDRTVALWDMTDPAHGRAVGDPITGHTDNINSIGFGAGGILASGGRDQAVRLWNLDVDRAVRRVCDTSPDTLTREAWDAYVSPDQSYDPPCGTSDDEGG